MKIETAEEVGALVGRTFERDGQQREVARVTDIECRYGTVFANIYWKRPGGKERTKPQWLPYFKVWLAKATEVTK